MGLPKQQGLACVKSNDMQSKGWAAATQCRIECTCLASLYGVCRAMWSAAASSQGEPHRGARSPGQGQRRFTWLRASGADTPSAQPAFTDQSLIWSDRCAGHYDSVD